MIGKKLYSLVDNVAAGHIIIIVNEQLLKEIIEVTARPKLKKYFSTSKVNELIDFLEIFAEKYETDSIHFLSRDPKDNFLIDLAHFSNADFLVTGDKDLLVLNPFKSTQILSPAHFEKLIKSN